MMESVVEGQDRLTDILSERETELAAIKKENGELRTEMEEMNEEADQSRKTIADLTAKVGWEKKTLLEYELRQSCI